MSAKERKNEEKRRREKGWISNLNYTVNQPDFYCQNIYISICLLFFFCFPNLHQSRCYSGKKKIKPHNWKNIERGEMCRGGVRKKWQQIVRIEASSTRTTGFPVELFVFRLPTWEKNTLNHCSGMMKTEEASEQGK